MRILFLFILTINAARLTAQQASYFDPAQAYNRLLIEKGSGTYRQVSNYKVTGTAYLFGEQNNGAIYSPNETGNNILITYDTYTQNVIFYPSANGPALTKEPGTVDSFLIKKNTEAMLEKDILFVYGSTLGVKDKVYFQAVSRGKRVSLYKKYTSELVIVSTNYIQSELREFKINVDYYYADSTGKGLKKLKISSKALAKEFASVKDLSGIINEDDLTANRENELIRLFGE
ncbi:MAG: hypothetical protein JNN00_05445, partial [Chitinophagaceae bacterium]|nr:hypothetical protein [Chitinophagaceae bacterium]